MHHFEPSAYRKPIAGRGATRGFTLVELLVVLAIIAIIAAIALPALTSLSNAYNLDSASQGVTAQFTVARQTAVATSHPVRVCFFQVAGATGTQDYRVIQSFLENDVGNFAGAIPTTGSIKSTNVNNYFPNPLVPISKPYFFPATVKIFTGQAGGTDASSLLDYTTYLGIYSSSGDTKYYPTLPLPPPYGNTAFNYIRIRSNGQIDQSGGNGSTAWTNGWLTLGIETAPLTSTGLPANYVTIQINAITGTVRVFRP